MGAKVGGVRRIGVLRANAVGDFVFALPALAALRSAYPSAELVLLGRSWHADFLRGRGVVDRVLSVPGPPGDTPWLGAPPAEVARFVDGARAETFDIALQLHGGGRNANPFVRSLGARVTAGLRMPDAPDLDRWVPYVYHQSEAMRLLEAVALVGAAPVGLDPGLALTGEDRRLARRELGRHRRPDAVLHPGATDPRRRWSTERFAAVGDALARRGLRVAVTGDAGERALTAAVVRTMRSPAVDIGGRTSLRGLAALLASARLVVANDTGPLHLAHALGTPTVGIYWAGNLLNGGPLTRERHRPVLSWTNACPTCGRSVAAPRCEHDPSFVDDVGVDAVLGAVDDLLALGPRAVGPRAVGSRA